MKLKQEYRIALIALAAIFTLATTVKIIFLPNQTLVWHLITSLVGLFFFAFFGLIVWGIDSLLDKRFPFEKNILTRIFLQFLITLAILFTIRIVSAPLLFHFLPFKISEELWLASFAINTFMVLSLILAIFGYHFFKRWKEAQITEAQLQKEKALVQYDNLKNQLNPHFLFNSLTSLNSLIFENPQLASDFLQQLSKVYRYVLDHKEKNLVSVETEVAFVKQYTQLLKTRFETGLEINFRLSENSLHKMIVPVTLQILIENAIKHNSTQKNLPLTIDVYDESQFLMVKNNVQKKNVLENSSRQGLENLKNLYHFLSIEPMTIEETDNLFTVKIPLLES